MQGCSGEGLFKLQGGPHVQSEEEKETKQKQNIGMKERWWGEGEGYTLILPGNPTADRTALD